MSTAPLKPMVDFIVRRERQCREAADAATSLSYASQRLSSLVTASVTRLHEALAAGSPKPGQPPASGNADRRRTSTTRRRGRRVVATTPAELNVANGGSLPAELDLAQRKPDPVSLRLLHELRNALDVAFLMLLELSSKNLGEQEVVICNLAQQTLQAGVIVENAAVQLKGSGKGWQHEARKEMAEALVLDFRALAERSAARSRKSSSPESTVRNTRLRARIDCELQWLETQTTSSPSIKYDCEVAADDIELTDMLVAQDAIKAKLYGRVDVAVRHVKPTNGITAFRDQLAQKCRTRHAHLIETYGCLFSSSGSQEDVPQVITEFVEGETLLSAVCNRRLTSFKAKIAFLRQVADGLHFIHNCLDAPHGSLSSSTILVGSKSKAKLTDYCLDTEGDEFFRPYAAPEESSGPCVAKTTDVWRFGVLAWELFSGRQAVTNEEASNGGCCLSKAVQSDQIQPLLVAMGWDCPTDVKDLVRDCLHVWPEKRPPALTILSRLNQLRYQLQTSTDDSIMAKEEPVPQKPRRSMWSLVPFASRRHLVVPESNTSSKSTPNLRKSGRLKSGSLRSSNLRSGNLRSGSLRDDQHSVRLSRNLKEAERKASSRSSNLREAQRTAMSINGSSPTSLSSSSASPQHNAGLGTARNLEASPCSSGELLQGRKAETARDKKSGGAHSSRRLMTSDLLRRIGPGATLVDDFVRIDQERISIGPETLGALVNVTCTASSGITYMISSGFPDHYNFSPKAGYLAPGESVNIIVCLTSVGPPAHRDTLTVVAALSSHGASADKHIQRCTVEAEFASDKSSSSTTHSSLTHEAATSTNQEDDTKEACLISPRSMQFVAGKTSSQEVRLSSCVDRVQYFKVMTSNTDRYSVKPAYGKLEPRGHISISISLSERSTNLSDVANGKATDKFIFIVMPTKELLSGKEWTTSSEGTWKRVTATVEKAPKSTGPSSLGSSPGTRQLWKMETEQVTFNFDKKTANYGRLRRTAASEVANICAVLDVRSQVDQTIAFKVLTTNPERFTVRPASGLVKARDRLTLEIFMAFPGDRNLWKTTLESIAKDRFLLVGVESKVPLPSNTWNSVPGVTKCRLPVKVISCPLDEVDSEDSL